MFALGTYILNIPDDGGHSEMTTNIDHAITGRLLGLVTDGSPIVRQACGEVLINSKLSDVVTLISAGVGECPSWPDSALRERV